MFDAAAAPQDIADDVGNWGTTPVARLKPSPLVPSRYGEARRPRWSALIGIILAHALLLFLLVKLDVIHVVQAKKEPLVVELLPVEASPPPPPEAATQPKPPVSSPIVTPLAIVAVAAPSPPPVITAPEPAPPTPPIISAPVSAAAGPPVAAPITPPDGMAASLRNPAPRYPVEARRKHQSGTVRLRVLITPEGRVREIRVARSSGVDSLDQAALETVGRWRFRPGLQAGVAVEAVGYLNIPFELKA